jgi:hypothetical protein
MGKRLDSPKDSVRERSGGKCEKCGEVLTPNVHGMPDRMTDRSIHHRQPRRCGGRDSAINMVNLCVGCHRGIHADEKAAQKDGWIVPKMRFPGHIPFRGWRGWVLPDLDGGLALLDFEVGRAVDLPRTGACHTKHRSARRQRHRSRPAKRMVRAA